MFKTTITTAVLVLGWLGHSVLIATQGAYQTLKGVVVARSVTECRYDGGPGKCTERYLVAQTFPEPERGSQYFIAAREFRDFESRPADRVLVDQELTFSGVRDAGCDRVITYEQIGSACGPSGSSKIFDWRVLSSKRSRPDEGLRVPCFRVAVPIPQLGS